MDVTPGECGIFPDICMICKKKKIKVNKKDCYTTKIVTHGAENSLDVCCSSLFITSQFLSGSMEILDIIQLFNQIKYFQLADITQAQCLQASVPFLPKYLKLQSWKNVHILW